MTIGMLLFTTGHYCNNPANKAFILKKSKFKKSQLMIIMSLHKWKSLTKFGIFYQI